MIISIEEHIFCQDNNDSYDVWLNLQTIQLRMKVAIIEKTYIIIESYYVGVFLAHYNMDKCLRGNFKHNSENSIWVKLKIWQNSKSLK